MKRHPVLVQQSHPMGHCCSSERVSERSTEAPMKQDHTKKVEKGTSGQGQGSSPFEQGGNQQNTLTHTHTHACGNLQREGHTEDKFASFMAAAIKVRHKQPFPRWRTVHSATQLGHPGPESTVEYCDPRSTYVASRKPNLPSLGCTIGEVSQFPLPDWLDLQKCYDFPNTPTKAEAAAVFLRRTKVQVDRWSTPGWVSSLRCKPQTAGRRGPFLEVWDAHMAGRACPF